MSIVEFHNILRRQFNKMSNLCSKFLGWLIDVTNIVVFILQQVPHAQHMLQLSVHVHVLNTHCVYFHSQEIQHRLKRHRNYVLVNRTLESMYVQVPPHELFMSDEVCAICWEKMNSACRLPCGHHFHM